MNFKNKAHVTQLQYNVAIFIICKNHKRAEIKHELYISAIIVITANYQNEGGKNNIITFLENLNYHR